MEIERDAVHRTGDPAESSAEQCVRRLRHGDPDAVNQVRARVSRILAYRGLAIPKEERDDLEQEVMTEVWQAVNRPSFDATAGFWGFVEVVTSRRSIDWLRCGKRARAEAPPAPEDRNKGPLRDALKRERLLLASEALSALHPSCRELITLRLKDGKTYGQLSKMLGRSEGALKVQMHRCIQSARETLRELMNRRGSHEELS